MKKLIFVRHGQSEGNANEYIADASTILTAAGIEQARATALKIKDKGITKIVCSPMVRAHQTAKLIAAELGIDPENITIIPELRERGLGELEGKPKNHSDMAEIETLLTVGHAIAGYYLVEIAEGKVDLKDFGPPQELFNAAFVEIDLAHHAAKITSND